MLTFLLDRAKHRKKVILDIHRRRILLTLTLTLTLTPTLTLTLTLTLTYSHPRLDAHRRRILLESLFLGRQRCIYIASVHSVKLLAEVSDVVTLTLTLTLTLPLPLPLTPDPNPRSPTARAPSHRS